MKKLLIIAVLFLITGSKGIAQWQGNDMRVQSWSAHKDNKMVLYWKFNSDTVEIIEPLQIHYIKIGKDVYQLFEHNTTIEKIATGQLRISSWSDGWNLAHPPIIDTMHYNPSYLPVTQ